MTRGVQRKAAPVTVAPTEDLAAVRALGVANGLDESVRDESGLVAAWAARDDDSGAMVGAIALEHVAGLDIVNWMSINESHRRQGIASRLLAELEAEARRRGVHRLWVTARAPVFFAASGFVAADDEREASYLLGDCPSCPQFGHGCHPRAMMKDLT